MKLWNALRARGRRPHAHLIGHIADAPTIIHQDDAPHMVFRVSEAPGIEFRMRAFPTTPRRHQGDRVEISYVHVDEHTAEVESLLAAPGEETMRQKRKDYLARIRKQVKRSRAMERSRAKPEC